MFCSCFSSAASKEDDLQHLHIDHEFYQVAVAYDVNKKHRTTMEDAYRVQIPFNGEESTGYFALFDGHSGKEAAQESSNHLHELLQTEIVAAGNTPDKKCFESAFSKMDDLLKTINKDKGTSAVTCVVRGIGQKFHLYVANVGDTRAILSRRSKAIRLTEDHTPLMPKEKQRLEAINALIFDNRINGVIRVSRALGDHSLKKWVTSEPDYVESTLSPADTLILFLGYRVYKVIDDQEAVDMSRG